MRSRTTLATTVNLILLIAVPTTAQLRVHDATRDAAAQDAKKAVERIESSDIFKKQSANLQALIDRDIETTVADARVEMESMINGLRQWSDVAELSERVKSMDSQLESVELDRRKQALADATRDLTNQIKGLSVSAASDADELKPLIDGLGDIDSALKFANDNLGVDNEGAKTAMTVLEKLQGLYKSYQDQFDVVNKADTRLRELKVNVKKALLARLKVEEDYLLTQVSLYARYDQEFKQIEHWKKECAVPHGIADDEYIDATLDRLAGDPAESQQLEKAVRALYACGSLAAEGMLPGRLLNLRLAQLDHLRSIQVSAANAKVYEAVLGGGVERLALFYEGGVKPETLAQLLQSLSTAGILGKLLSQ